MDTTKPECPQCHEPINGIDVKSFSVGWCGHDIHLACLDLHVRVCHACRPPNEPYIARQSKPVAPKPRITNAPRLEGPTAA